MPDFRRKTIEVEAVKLTVAVTINNGDGTSAQAEAGDYLVSYPSGLQRIVKADEFEEDFEPVRKLANG